MARTYKVLGQSVSEQFTRDITFKSASANIVTVTTASANYAVVGHPVTVAESSLVASVTNRSRTASVATLTTSTNHRITAGQSITVAGLESSFNGSYIVTSASANTVSYTNNSASVSASVVSGTITYLDRAFNGTYVVVNDPTPTTFSYYAPSVNLTNTSASSSNTTIVHEPWKVVYTCQPGTSIVSSTVMICNNGISNAQYQLAVAGDTSPSKENLIVYNDIIEPNESITYTIGLILDETTKYLLFAADNPDVSISLFGSVMT